MNTDLAAFTLSSTRRIAAINFGGGWLLLAGIVVFLLILLNIILGVALYRSKTKATGVPSTEEFRGRLAQVVTMWAIVAIAVLGVAIIGIGGYNASIATDDVDTARREFLDTAKYVFAAVLPVVAAWVGTVMAFYFGRENFRAATESVAQVARQLTSQEKLGQIKAQEIGKPIDDVTPLRLAESDPMETTLNKLEEKMGSQEPPFERLPILSANAAPLMVVHRSVLNDFLLKKKATEKDKDAKDYKLSDLIAAYPWLKDDSFATIPPAASAAEAKAAMARLKRGTDVFVTLDGTSSSTATRWITNVDLLQAAQV